MISNLKVHSVCALYRPGESLWVNPNGVNGKPTFRRRANLSWLSAICIHFADIHVTRDTFGPCELTTQTTPRSVQPSLHRWPRCVSIVYMVCLFPPQNFPLLMLASGLMKYVVLWAWLSATCIHFADIAAWSRMSLTMFTQKLAFLEKDPLRANFQKCFPKEFMATQIHVLCANFVKFGWPEVGEIARCLPHKK